MRDDIKTNHESILDEICLESRGRAPDIKLKKYVCIDQKEC